MQNLIGYVVLGWLMLISAGCGGGGNGSGGALNPVGGSSSSSSAASKDWGTAALLETSVDAAEYPDIAVDASGNAIAVWQQGGSTLSDAKQIFASRYTSTGGSAGGWGARIAIGAAPASSPQVAMCPSGNAFATWLSSGSVWVVKYTTGTGWGTALTIDSSAGEASGIYVVCDALGNAYAAWGQWDGAASSIYANRYTDASGWFGASLLENDAGNAYPSALVVDAASQVTALWEQFGTTAATNGIRLARYASGTGWSAVTTIAGTAGATYSDIAVDGGGNAELVWTLGGNLYASRYTSGSWSTAVTLETAAGEARLPNIVMDATGNATVAWEQNDGTYFSIYANRSTSGSGWGTAQLIESNSGDSYGARLAVDANGAVMATWIRQNGYYDVYANRYASGSWGTATLLENNTGSAYDPQPAFDSSGNAFAIWYQFDPSISNIWVNRYQ